MSHVTAIVWELESALLRPSTATLALPVRGADEPMRDIPARLCRFAAISDRPAAQARAHLEQLGWAPRFDVVVGADEARGADALRLALERLGVTPSEAFAVVGRPDGVIAAAEASLRVVGLGPMSALPSLRRATWVVSAPGAITDLWRGLR